MWEGLSSRVQEAIAYTMCSSISGWCACPPSGTNAKNSTLKSLESDLWKREKGEEGKREKEGRGREKRTEEEEGGREERRRRREKSEFHTVKSTQWICFECFSEKFTYGKLGLSVATLCGREPLRRVTWWQLMRSHKTFRNKQCMSGRTGIFPLGWAGASPYFFLYALLLIFPTCCQHCVVPFTSRP